MANVIVPVTIVLILGAAAAAMYHRIGVRNPSATVFAALTAGAVWTLGCIVFLQVMAPSEAWQGWSDVPYALTAFAVVSLVSLVSLAPVMFVGYVLQGKR